MTEHGAGVAKGEIDVVLAVHVGEMGPPGFGDVDGIAPRPLLHPVHRGPVEEAFESAGVERFGTWVGRLEAGLLAL